MNETLHEVQTETEHAISAAKKDMALYAINMAHVASPLIDRFIHTVQSSKRLLGCAVLISNLRRG